MGRLVGRHGHLDPGLWKPARINANYAAICEVPVLGWHLFTSKWCTETSIKPGNKTLTLLKREMIGKSIDSNDGWWITNCRRDTCHTWSWLGHIWNLRAKQVIHCVNIIKSKMSYHCFWDAVYCTSTLKMSNWPFHSVNTIVSLLESQISLCVW